MIARLTRGAWVAVGFVTVLTVAPVAAGAEARQQTRPGSDLTITITAKPTGVSTSASTATVEVQGDGTYSANFGITDYGPFSAGVVGPDGKSLGTASYTVTSTPKPCDAQSGPVAIGVTHTKFLPQPGFPSFITVCGTALAATTSSTSTTTTTAAASDRETSEPSGAGRSDGDGGGNLRPLWLGLLLAGGIVAVVGLIIFLTVLGGPDDDEDDDDIPPPQYVLGGMLRTAGPGSSEGETPAEGGSEGESPGEGAASEPEDLSRVYPDWYDDLSRVYPDWGEAPPSPIDPL